MRYVVAMLFAIAAAALAMLFVSGAFANWAVARFAFDNPDQVSDLHSAAFMGMNAVALVLGWMLGWSLGGAIVAREGED